MIHQFSGIFTTYQRDCQILNLNHIYCSGISFIKTGIPINFIKVINAKIVIWTLVFNNIMLSKNSSDIFMYHFPIFFFNYQNIYFHRFCSQLMLILKNQTVCIFLQFNLNICKKCRVPLQNCFILLSGILSVLIHIEPPYISQEFPPI